MYICQSSLSAISWKENRFVSIGLFNFNNPHISPCFCFCLTLMWCISCSSKQRCESTKWWTSSHRPLNFPSGPVDGTPTPTSLVSVRRHSWAAPSVRMLYRIVPLVFCCQIPVCDRRARSCLTHICMRVCVRAPGEEQASLSSWATEETWLFSSPLRSAGKPSSSQLLIMMSMLLSTISLF